MASSVTDHPFTSKGDGHTRDACASRAEVAGDLFVRQRQLIVPHAVMDHHQPTAQPLSYFMTAVADNPLGDLFDASARVGQYQALQRPAATEFLPDDFRLYSQGVASDRDLHPM